MKCQSHNHQLAEQGLAMTNHHSHPLKILCMMTLAACLAGCQYSEHAAQQASNTPAARPLTAEQSASAQETFASPEDAVVRLIHTCRSADFDQLIPIFGPQIAELGADTRTRTEGDMQRIAAAYDRSHSLVREDDGSVTLLVGENGWDFPAPIVSVGDRWRFDTDAGIIEMRARRIERNETDAVRTCMDLIAAQHQFFAMSGARGDRTPTYASRIRSTPGKRDGLYWDDDLGQPFSPLGPMVAKAVEAGDLDVQKGPQPYRGYVFRVLTGQGRGAPGGVKSFIDAYGRMTDGFAFLAWPAEYGETGTMTFQVSFDGAVFQKDLGEGTASTAQSMMVFDPQGWERKGR